MDLALLCTEVNRLVKQVGAFIRQEGQQFDTTKIELKAVNNLVSYVDKEAEQQLVSGLQKMLPEAGFIAEEGSASNNNEEYLWIVDPLDGTTNFSHGLPVFSISVALSLRGEHILGVVYEVNREECFYAWKNGGAYLNGQPISTSSVKSLDRSLLATGFPYYLFEKLDNYIEILKEFMQGTHGPCINSFKISI